MKYIDAEKLIKFKEALADIIVSSQGICAYQDCKDIAEREASLLISTLQQEQPEVDLEKEIHRFFEECIVVHEVPLYGKVKERVISADCYEIIAYHFYKLGRLSNK